MYIKIILIYVDSSIHSYKTRHSDQFNQSMDYWITGLTNGSLIEPNINK